MEQQQKSAKTPKSVSVNKGFIPQQNPNKHFSPKGGQMVAPRMNKAVKRGNR